MLCVGLTGPIASGKSTVAALFMDLGAELIDADQIAKQLTAPGQPALLKIIEHFGQGFLNNEGELKRRLLREFIFQYPKERLWLEQLLHPLIRKEIESRLKTPPKLYYIIEIPLLLNKTHYPYLNRIVLVLADPHTQRHRLMTRDNQNLDQAHAVMQTQANEQKYRTVADDIIINHGSLEDLEKEVRILHQRYCNLL